MTTWWLLGEVPSTFYVALTCHRHKSTVAKETYVSVLPCESVLCGMSTPLQKRGDGGAGHTRVFFELFILLVSRLVCGDDDTQLWTSQCRQRFQDFFLFFFLVLSSIDE